MVHGGTVKAESEGEGRGATFTVALPIPALLLEPKAPMTIIDRAARAVPVSAPEPAAAVGEAMRRFGRRSRTSS